MAEPSSKAATHSDPTLVEAGQVAERLEVDVEAGLSPEEASNRLGRYGPNELVSTGRDPAWKRFLRQFGDPLVYLLLVAIVISMVAWFAEGAGGVPVDAIVIAAIVIANAVIGFVQENKAQDAVAALSDMTAAHSTVLRGGKLTDVESSEIVPGDILVLAEGDAVGADARLLSSSSLKIQEASLTGESEAVTKHAAVLPGPVSLGDRLNMVYKGTAVARGVGRAVVTGTGMQTEMGRIATLLDETEDEQSPLQKEIAKVSKMLGLLVIVIAVVVMAALALINGVDSASELVDILLMGVSLAVAAVPEGLPAILSLVLAIGVQLLAKRNAVMKDLHSVETLGSVSVICSDKTGTLTRNEMMLCEVVTASGRVSLSGTGYEPVGEVRLTGRNEDDVLAEVQRVLATGSVANNAQLEQVDGHWQIQGDPTEAAFLVGGRKLEGISERVEGFQRQGEAPFDSDRKLMSVLGHSHSLGVSRVLAKGAPDVLLERCVAEQVGGATRPLSEQRRADILATVEELNERGNRTLGVAWRDATPSDAEGGFDEGSERDLVWAGFVGIIDPPREEAAQAISEAHRAGIRTVMITGDHPVTASRIAADLGIVEGDEAPRAVTGRELDELDDDGWREVVLTTSVYARVSPEHKLRIVDALQEQRLIVAMTGDGVNDAPALKSADIGIAMGITGTEVTKEAGEMILGDDNYSTIVEAVRQGRVIYDNIKKFIRYLLSSNMGEVATVFLGVVLGGVIGLADPGNPGATVVPLLATQILWINLVTDSGPALAMGVDPQIDDVMARKPRGYDERIIDAHMWSRIIFIGVVMGVISLVLYDLCLPGGLLGGLEYLAPAGLEFDVARTTVFTALVFMQLFNALNSRSDMGSAFDHLFTNKWLWGSFAVVTLGQVLVVEVPFLQSAFGTTSLDPIHWGMAVLAGLVVLGVEEVAKAVRRARAASR
ncbi:potassium and/or sodium efflux P-type ATPase [Tessaracoccus bendigoensis DSM 12906]|uniref:Potassium and/or sodium efflux P-type ATPase n=1 Tax=Tessaracoccus bendigoensis DSM 12906 TaxID=1123357 RepID=A0A1M6HL99_9ACTN|nr:cation-translocating P-type ATPase [Tessaracoccus bendigoensis]SHJ22974.1 potassium and/or sodium efflux P-type ATPase [Tessaracoccus bendigoensis DSM 12906]